MGEVDKQQLTSLSAIGIQGIQRRPDCHLIHIDYNRIGIQIVVIIRLLRFVCKEARAQGHRISRGC